MYRYYVVFYNGVFADRAISKVVRLIDTKRSEREYVEVQLGEK